MSKLAIALSVALACVTFTATAARADDGVRIAGSTSLGKLIKAKASDIETAAGTKFTLVANSSGRGLADLVGGKADLAMVSGTLAIVAEDLNAKTPGAVSVDALKEFQVGTEGVAVIANSKSKATAITVAQFRDVFSGKITNWKDLGGDDQAIIVVLPPATDGVRTFIAKDVMGDAKFVTTARVMQLGPDAVKVASQLEGAISFASAGNAGDTVKTLKTDKPIELKLNLVSKGDPTDVQKKLIAAVKEKISK